MAEDFAGKWMKDLDPETHAAMNSFFRNLAPGSMLTWSFMDWLCKQTGLCRNCVIAHWAMAEGNFDEDVHVLGRYLDILG